METLQGGTTVISDPTMWPPAGRLRLHRRSLAAGILGVALLGGFYAGVVGAAGGLDHLRSQARSDWYWLALIFAGFGTQIALFVELRRRHRANRGTTAAAGTGAGASAVGMVACCAHHVADIAPILGASGAATFFTDARVPIMAAGVAVNALGVAIAVRRLRRASAVTASSPGKEEQACAA